MFKMKDDPKVGKVGKLSGENEYRRTSAVFNEPGRYESCGNETSDRGRDLSAMRHHKGAFAPARITGMWQVSGRSDIQNFEDVVRLDLEYIDNWSVWLDIKILFQTILVVLFHRGAK